MRGPQLWHVFLAVGLIFLLLLSWHGWCSSPVLPPTFGPLSASVTEVMGYIDALLPEHFSGECESLFKTPIAKFSLKYLKQLPLLHKLRADWGDQVVQVSKDQ